MIVKILYGENSVKKEREGALLEFELDRYLVYFIPLSVEDTVKISATALSLVRTVV